MSKRLYRGIASKPLAELEAIKGELLAEVALIDMAIALRAALDARREEAPSQQELPLPDWEIKTASEEAMLEAAPTKEPWPVIPTSPKKRKQREAEEAVHDMFETPASS